MSGGPRSRYPALGESSKISRLRVARSNEGVLFVAHGENTDEAPKLHIEQGGEMMTCKQSSGPPFRFFSVVPSKGEKQGRVGG